MSRDNPLRPRQPVEDRPVLVAGPHAEGPQTPAPEALPVWVDLVWVDGHTERAMGRARAWTRDAVCVSATTSRGGYYTWVNADQVSRR